MSDERTDGWVNLGAVPDNLGVRYTLELNLVTGELIESVFPPATPSHP